MLKKHISSFCPCANGCYALSILLSCEPVACQICGAGETSQPSEAYVFESAPLPTTTP
jgi:hypothetical protein